MSEAKLKVTAIDNIYHECIHAAEALDFFCVLLQGIYHWGDAVCKTKGMLKHC